MPISLIVGTVATGGISTIILFVTIITVINISLSLSPSSL
jgi:hypothetical protein